MTTPSGSFGDPLTSAGGISSLNDFTPALLGDLYNYIYGRLPRPATPPTNTGLTLTATDTGIVYILTVAGTPPALVFSPTPDVADIRGFFPTVANLRSTVPTVKKLRTYGT